jgi:maltose O-acetyltransferase
MNWAPASWYERALARLTREPGEVVPLFWRAVVNSVVASELLPTRVRALCYRVAGLDLPWGARIAPGVVFRTPRVTIGVGTSLNRGCIFDNRARVTIGRRVGVGIGVKFITSGHDLSDPQCRAGAGNLREITVGDGAWIGSSATVVGGVTIGAGAVVAAGAVVVRDCDEHGLYGGVPAALIRWLPPKSDEQTPTGRKRIS